MLYFDRWMGAITLMWDWLKESVLRTFWNKVSDAASSEDPAAAEAIRLRAAAVAPIIWLVRQGRFWQDLHYRSDHR